MLLSFGDDEAFLGDQVMFQSLAGGSLASQPRLCPGITMQTFCLEARPRHWCLKVLRGDRCAAGQELLLSMSPCLHAAEGGSCPQEGQRQAARSQSVRCGRT